MTFAYNLSHTCIGESSLHNSSDRHFSLWYNKIYKVTPFKILCLIQPCNVFDHRHVPFPNQTQFIYLLKKNFGLEDACLFRCNFLFLMTLKISNLLIHFILFTHVNAWFWLRWDKQQENMLMEKKINNPKLDASEIVSFVSPLEGKGLHALIFSLSSTYMVNLNYILCTKCTQLFSLSFFFFFFLVHSHDTPSL